MEDLDRIDNIKNELIKSCMRLDAKSFIPFLLDDIVLTRMPNKMRFYRFFKYMLNNINAKGKLIPKIEDEKTSIIGYEYFINFYDNYHKYSRLSIQVIESEGNIKIVTLPF